MQVAKEMALSARRLEGILRIQSPVIFGSLLCQPELDIREKLLPYIEEALKIEKGRKVFRFFWTLPDDLGALRDSEKSS
jgi:hypothetical protein